jgi:hypothetical protein
MWYEAIHPNEYRLLYTRGCCILEIRGAWEPNLNYVASTLCI